STRMGGRFWLFMRTSRRPDRSRSRRLIQRDHEVHGGASSRTLAGCPDPPAERGNGIRAPVQSDAVVGFPGLGRETLLEYPAQIIRRDADPVVAEQQMELIAIGLAFELAFDLQQTFVLSRLLDRIGRIDDDVLHDKT